MTLPAPSAAELVSLLHADQLRRWQRGEPVPVEAYLQRHPALAAHPEQVVDLIYAELVLREQHGERPQLDDYLQRFPAHAEALRRQFRLHQAMQDSGLLDGLMPSTLLPSDTPQRPSNPADGASLPTVAGYEIEGELGRGGMGVVYKARQLRPQRTVALKMILAGAHAEDHELARFRAEAEAVARLQHPGVVQIYEVGEHQGLPFFSLEYCAGGSLAAKLRGTPLPPPEAAQLVETVARAMHAAHQVGVIHRDLKPANVLLSSPHSPGPPLPQGGEGGERPSSSPPPPEGEGPGVGGCLPKITDFGLAKKLDEAAGPTQTGAILGTPSYMAPEQARGRNDLVGPATDVYALGAVLYECLTGRPPFRAATPAETMMQVLTDDPVPVRQLQPKVARDLETICLKCLQKDSKKRYPSATDLADDLRRFLDGKPILARPVGRVERALKWARRRPAAAALLAVSVLSLVLATAAGLWFTAKLRAERTNADNERINAESERDKARNREEEAKKARADAESEKQRAKDAALAAARDRDAKDAALQETRRGLAARNVMLAEAAWREGSLPLAHERLGEVPEELRPWEWRFLHRQYTGGYATLYGHQYGRICGVCFSPDGRWLASSSIDKTVKVWDATTGRLAKTLTGFPDMVRGVAFSSDGTRIAAACWSATVWDAATGRLLQELAGNFGTLHAVAFSPDGDTLAGAGNDGTVRLWNLRTGKEARALLGHAKQVTAVAFGPDGRTLVSASLDATARVWDVASGKEVRSFDGGHNSFYAVAVSPDGERLAAGGSEMVVRLWDVHTGRDLGKCTGPQSTVLSLAFSPDGQRVASSDLKGVVRLWDATTCEALGTFRGHSEGAWCVAYSPDGQRLASGSDDTTIKLWDVRGSAADRLVLHGHQRHGSYHAVTGVAFGPDSQTLASVSAANATIQLWDLRTGQDLRTLQTVWTSLGKVSYSPDGSRLASARGDKTVKVWDTQSGRELLTLQGHTDWVSAVAYSPDGRLASGGNDRLVKVWDENGRELQTCKGHTNAVMAVAWDRTGKRLASTGKDGSIRVWDPASGAALLTLANKPAPVPAVAFSPDGRRLVSTSWDQAVQVWDAQSGERLFTLKGHTGPVVDVCFNGDGTLLASLGDEKVKVWDVRSGRLCLTLEGPEGVRAIDFSRDGQRLAAVGANGVIQVWDARPLGEPPSPKEQLDADAVAFRRGVAALDVGWQRERVAKQVYAGHWFAAAVHERLLADADPSDGELQSELALLQAASHQRDAGRRTCLRMLERYQQPGERAAVAQLLASRPGDGCTTAALSQTVAQAIERWQRGELQTRRTCMILLNEEADRDTIQQKVRGGDQIALALVYARTGDQQAAVKHLSGRSDAIGLLVLALAEHGRGQPVAAKEALDRAVAWLGARAPGSADQTNSDQLMWWDQVEVHLLREEVEALLAAKQP